MYWIVVGEAVGGGGGDFTYNLNSEQPPAHTRLNYSFISDDGDGLSELRAAIPYIPEWRADGDA